MQAKDPYVVLGLTSDATQQQVEDAYRTLKKHYEEKRFCEGEEGAQASRALNEIEWAYRDCLDDLQRKVSFSDTGSRFGAVESLIKQGKIEEAQSQLDMAEPRDGEWHYLQAVIYYKRNWHVESKKQLEIAMKLDPDNTKYKTTYDKLTAQLNNVGANNAGNQNQSSQRGGYSRPYPGQAGADNANACCNTCSTLICCDCCCECMGGDLIPCC